MSHELNILSTKAKAIEKTLSGMPDAEKAKRPSLEFGKDYNSLRCDVLKAMSDHPEIHSKFPPSVEVYQDEYEAYTKARYVEIHSYVSQISGFIEMVLNDGRENSK